MENPKKDVCAVQPQKAGHRIDTGGRAQTFVVFYNIYSIWNKGLKSAGFGARGLLLSLL
ncbi:MAG TPA: hypothetical protein PLX33_10240 [Alphaproteobacteria bacterium]|nr:hypothetical protein [Alphaproteobacteria bacterium]